MDEEALQKVMDTISDDLDEMRKTLVIPPCGCAVCRGAFAFVDVLRAVGDRDNFPFLESRVELFRGYFQVTLVLFGFGFQAGVRLKG